MPQLLKLFIEICFFRAKPEQLPYSFSLMVLSIITYIIAWMMLCLVNLSVSKSILVVTVNTVMMLGFSLAGLWIRSLVNRAVKTITAVTGTGILFTLLALPLMIVLHDQPQNQITMASLLVSLLVIWNIGVLGHILRNALSLPAWAGIGIAVVYFYTWIRVLAALSIA